MPMKKRWPITRLYRALTLSYSFSTTPTTALFPLKHVKRSNFDSALSSLSHHIRAADFVAIDLEMTGITSAPWRDSFEFDRFDVLYLKVKDSAEKFAIFQFGVCPFRWDTLKQSFIAHPHNFFIFPRQDLPLDGPAYEFLCQTTSIDFLAKYQFDFNACIHEGVSYLSRKQEDEALKRVSSIYKDELLDSWHSMKETRDTLLVNVVDILFTERMKNKLSEWRDGLLHGRSGGSKIKPNVKDSREQFQTIFFKMRPAISLNGFTTHQLQLIQLKEVKDEQHREVEMTIKAAIGFRHVIDLLSSEKKLIVGHNCFLDLAHIYSKFLGPLPFTAEEFISSVNNYFPHIIDTKILLNSNNILQQRMKKSSTSLSSAFSILCPQIALGFKSSHLTLQSCVKVEVEVDDMRSSNWNSGAKHEAGYDAFMTGCVLAQACSCLGIESSENLVHNEKLQEHINLLYLSWTNGDVINLSTGKRTSEPLGSSKRKNRYPKILFECIVLVWGFPRELKVQEIRECVSKALDPTSVISVYQVDETAVFVQFNKAEMVSEFLGLKESLERSNDPISVLHPLAKLLEGGNTHAASYETYKEICGSSVSKVLFADQAEAVGIRWKTKLESSKLEVETKEQENPVNSDSILGVRTKDAKIGNVTNDSLSSDEIIDSFYTTVAKLIRTF